LFSAGAALKAEQAALQRERPKAEPKPNLATPQAFEGLDLGRQRAVVESSVEAIVVSKAARRGAP
jgi:hypothetical protein